jgi:hypothetical protein
MHPSRIGSRFALTLHFKSPYTSTSPISAPIIACEGVVAGRAREAIECSVYNSGAIPPTIPLGVEIAYAMIFVAIGNVDAVSVVVAVTVGVPTVLSRPRYVHLTDVVGATRIGVVVDLHLFRC